MNRVKRFGMAILAGIMSFATIATAAGVEGASSGDDKVPWAVIATGASTLLAAALLRWGAKIDRMLDTLNEKLEAQDKMLTRLLAEHELFSCKLKEYKDE